MSIVFENVVNGWWKNDDSLKSRLKGEKGVEKKVKKSYQNFDIFDFEKLDTKYFNIGIFMDRFFAFYIHIEFCTKEKIDNFWIV